MMFFGIFRASDRTTVDTGMYSSFVNFESLSIKRKLQPVFVKQLQKAYSFGRGSSGGWSPELLGNTVESYIACIVRPQTHKHTQFP